GRRGERHGRALLRHRGHVHGALRRPLAPGPRRPQRRRGASLVRAAEARRQRGRGPRNLARHLLQPCPAGGGLRPGLRSTLFLVPTNPEDPITRLAWAQPGGDGAPRRSLVLAGGGMRVAYQAGAIHALLEEGLGFAHADGTSGGTMNLAMLMSGLT